MKKNILDEIIKEMKEEEQKKRKKDEGKFDFIDDLVHNMIGFIEPHKVFTFYGDNITKKQENTTKDISKEDEKVFNEVFNAKPKENDKTNPLHYKTTNVETIDNIYNILGEEAFYGFTIGNVIKYVSRYNTKNGVEDLEKARWYLSETIARMSGTNNEYRK